MPHVHRKRQTAGTAGPLEISTVKEAFDAYLTEERGVTVASKDSYWFIARRFLAECGRCGGPPVDREAVAVDRGAAMTGLERAIDQYVGLRRRLGFRLAIQRGILYRFAKFAAKEKASVVTTDLVLRWVSGMIDVLPATAARSFSVVRQFAVWWKARDPRTQIPPARLVARRYQRRVPFLHTAHQLRRLLTAAKRLESKNGIRGLTYSTLFGLIAAAGLRISEAVNLDGADVNLAEGVLTIRGTKFGKTRLVPLHPSTTSALAKYAARRDRIMANVRSPAFFLSERGRRVTDWSTRYNFAHVSQQVGDRPSQRGSAGPRRSRYRHGCGPRLHDLRHRFAAETLLAWYRAGSDVERELPKLATYLGHVKMEHTYWYIEAVPELLQLASDRVAGRTDLGARR